jgi:hypothetical protein
MKNSQIEFYRMNVSFYIFYTKKFLLDHLQPNFNKFPELSFSKVIQNFLKN